VLKVDFHKEEIEREKIIYVVITAFYKNALILVKHRERTTWEIPGGDREKNESAQEAAFFNSLPKNLTYPKIQPRLYKKVFENYHTLYKRRRVPFQRSCDFYGI